jgi:hypothetical protein
VSENEFFKISENPCAGCKAFKAAYKMNGKNGPGERQPYNLAGFVSLGDHGPLGRERGSRKRPFPIQGKIFRRSRAKKAGLKARPGNRQGRQKT